MAKFDIFIVHSSTDKDAVRELAHRLKESGLSTWIDDEQLSLGQPWQEATEKALFSVRCVLVFVGRSGIAPYAQSEISYGVRKQNKNPNFKFMLILGPGASPDDIPFYLRTFTLFDLRESSKREFAKLEDALNDRPPTTKKDALKDRPPTSKKGALKDRPPTTKKGALKDRLPTIKRRGRYSPKVFLCHAKEDAERIEALYYLLQDQGLDPWYDKKNLTIGDDWDEEIFRAIEKTDFFAICLSPRSVGKRGFVQKEIKTAVKEYQHRPHGDAFLLPLRLEACDVPRIKLDTNKQLPDLHWIDIFEDDDNAIEEFAQGVWTQWNRRNKD